MMVEYVKLLGVKGTQGLCEASQEILGTVGPMGVKSNKIKVYVQFLSCLNVAVV